MEAVVEEVEVKKLKTKKREELRDLWTKIDASLKKLEDMKTCHSLF